MRSKIIIITLVISVILVIGLTVFGIKIGNFEIPSISNIIAKNKQINSDIEKLSQLTSVDYTQKITEFEKTVDGLKVQKEKYEQLSGFSDEEENSTYETEKYDISYLWTTIGNYANKNQVKLAMDVKKSSTSNLYDLYFTVKGEYVNISSFITKIENDSKLLFRIYNFKITKENATFTVKDINIDNTTLIKESNGLQSIKDTKNKE